eukprot:g4413.t1
MPRIERRCNLLMYLFVLVTVRFVDSVRWHHFERPMEREERAYFAAHPEGGRPDLFPNRLGKVSAELGYARGGATSLKNLEHPPSRKIFRKHGNTKSQMRPNGNAMRFRGSKKFIQDYEGITSGAAVNLSYPVPSTRYSGWSYSPEPSIEDQWVLAYSQMGSEYGRGVRDYNTPFYGSFGHHNYGPIGIPHYASDGDPRDVSKTLPWNYSQPWDGPGPHPMWPVPPTLENSTQYNPDAIAWMTHKNFNLMDSIQPIGTGDRAGKPAMPPPGPAMPLRTGGYGKSIDEYVQSRINPPTISPGVPFSPPSQQGGGGGAALRFRRQHVSASGAGSEVALGDENNRAPSVIFDPNDVYEKLYINATNNNAMFPFDRTGNLASAPFTGFPSQWSTHPYPYGSAGEMPGTSGHPEPHPNWFWLKGEIPRTLPGISDGNGWYLHGGAVHPHLPMRSMMERMSLWPGNVGLMNTKQKNYVPAIAAMRAAALRPPTTGPESELGHGGVGYTVGGDLQGMRDHYGMVPVEPIPPPGLAGQTQGPSNVGISGARF